MYDTLLVGAAGVVAALGMGAAGLALVVSRRNTEAAVTRAVEEYERRRLAARVVETHARAYAEAPIVFDDVRLEDDTAPRLEFRGPPPWPNPEEHSTTPEYFLEAREFVARTRARHDEDTAPSIPEVDEATVRYSDTRGPFHHVPRGRDGRPLPKTRAA